MRPDPDLFAVLVRCIVSQQISTAAAATISGRLLAVLGPAGLTHAGVLALDDEALRACGLSAAKRRAVRDLASHPHTTPAALAALVDLDDAAVARHLLPVRGVGPWTVDMVLMFGLGRPDVLPVGDLGLRLAVRDEFGLAELPGPQELETLAASWRPYRTVATWYMWRSRGAVPQSDDTSPAVRGE
jgi:DNA-3-methyladenine glycosylase II